MGREPFVKASYDPKDDHTQQPQGNFTDTINAIVQTAQAARNKNNRRKQYGAYSSKGAQSSPEARRLTNRITGEKDD